MKKLRWIDFTNLLLLLDSTIPLIIMPENFPPRELCCQTLDCVNTKELWEGYKYLPNLRMISLCRMFSLIKTPELDGLPNLERFIVDGCRLLEEIDPSFGRLEKLACVELRNCDNLEMLPPITRSRKLETLVISRYKYPSKKQQNMDTFLLHSKNHIGQWFSNECLRKLDLIRCNLGDGDIRSAAVWELPNLQELNLIGNRFVRLNFSLLRLPRLQYLNISYCKYLVKLSELPSSIAVVIAEDCTSLENFGDISKCKWLWKVSLNGCNKLGPLSGDNLLGSIYQGNAKDYFISIVLTGIDIWRGFILWLNLVKTYNMPLPHDWYNHFSGILMFLKSKRENNYYGEKPEIIIELGANENFQVELGQESNGSLEIDFDDTFIGYVSFSSLRHTGCLNSTYNVISISLCNEEMYEDELWFRAVLVPKDNAMQITKVATDYSKFWDEKERLESKTFTIKHDSNSSIKILWDPCSH